MPELRRNTRKDDNPKQRKLIRRDWLETIREHALPIIPLVLICLGLLITQVQPNLYFKDTFQSALSRAIIVLALIMPIRAGLGFNFAIAIGAMSGQLGVILVINSGVSGPLALASAFFYTTLLALLVGYLAGKIINKARGYEMITSLFLSYCVNSIYQLICLGAFGRYIPIKSPDLVLPIGTGLRNTIDLRPVFGTASYLLSTVALLFVIAAFAYLKSHNLKTTPFGLKDDLLSGNTDSISERYRVQSVVISIVLAAWGQVVFLQNFGIVNTYGSHLQVGTLTVLALIIGGGSIKRARVHHALVGIILLQAFLALYPLLFAGKGAVNQYTEIFRTLLFNAVMVYTFIQHKKIER